MKTGYVLYNLKAGSGRTLDDVQKVADFFSDEMKLIDILTVENYGDFFQMLNPEDYIVICGGDGTINRFVNDTEGKEYSNEIFYYPIGTGNDFANDLNKGKDCEPFCITKYLKNLPIVTVNGKSYRFINGVGFGIDGYCCEVGDALKEKSDKPVNYTAIAVKGLLFYFKPKKAKVTVDGKEYNYKKVWIAPTMFGRYYGGGMNAAPNQERLSENPTVSTVLIHGHGRLRTLVVFPSIFKGEHVKHKNMVSVLTGHNITVEFDQPAALQIDGEKILGVTSYRVQIEK